MLLALGCTFWLAGILVMVYNEFEIGNQSQPTFTADLLFFLHTVPFMASLALMPHARKMRETLRFGLIDLLLLGGPVAIRLHLCRDAMENRLARSPVVLFARFRQLRD